MSPSIARVRFLDLGGLGGRQTAGGIYASVASTTGGCDLDQRAFFAIPGHSTAVFLVLGNHENEEGWNLNDFGANVQNSLPVLGAMSDATGGRVRYLFGFTVAAVMGTALIGLASGGVTYTTAQQAADARDRYAARTRRLREAEAADHQAFEDVRKRARPGGDPPAGGAN